MSNPKITYLLGAGASANAIPVVEKFDSDVITFLNELKAVNFSNEKFEGFDSSIPISKTQLRERMYQECYKLMEEAKNHMTIDTYARKLHLTEKKENLRILKALISIFLIYKQLRMPVDKRYDVFYATLFDNSKVALVLPSSINIVTWNYDFQLEKAASPFLQAGHIQYVQNSLNIYPNNSHRFRENTFGVVKLNGTALGWRQGDDNYDSFNFDLLNSSKVFATNPNLIWDSLLGFYYWSTYPPTETIFALTFAWENDRYSLELRNAAKQILSKTTHLVIIGYSFPTFNRRIDKDLLDGMTKLEKVIIQTKEESIEEVNYRFCSLLGKERLETPRIPGIKIELIKMKSGHEEFYIPFEYTGQ